MSPGRVVVVGNGMAGARLAEEIRRRDPCGEQAALTMVGAERRHAYNRVLLSAVLAGSMSIESLWLHDRDWAGQQGIDLRLGVRAVALDCAARRATLSDGSTLRYDALVLATGSRAWVPPIAGLVTEDGSLAQGVATFRTLDDCEQIIAAAQFAAPAVVLGGGLLGLEAARGLAARGNPVTVVHPVQHLMERQLDPPAGRVLLRTLGELGIECRLGVPAERYLPGAGLMLADGTRVPASVVVVSAGVRAEVSLAVDAGLSVDKGVRVDDSLRTSDPRVYAIGDCAQHRDMLSGLVQPAWEQASVLAGRLTGATPAARYVGTPVVTRLKARDIDLAALGEVHVGMDCEDAEVVRVEDPARGRYAKLVLRGERITGAILLGAPEAAATITHLYDRGIPAPTDRLALLLGRGLLPAVTPVCEPAGLPASSVVCRCSRVTKGQLAAAFRAGHRTVSALSSATRASTGCGMCREKVCRIAEWLARVAEPAAAS